jgi:PAT family beta-lactamase induction signal transducer AmpG
VFGSLALVPDPLNNIGILTAICFTINFFVGFQDVATDGMAVDILPVEDQPRATSIMFGGATVSAAVSSAAGGWALNRYGVAIPSIACAGLIALISSFLLVSRERLGERLLPWTEGRATIDPLYRRPENLREIGRNLRAFLFLRASLLAIAATTIYQFGRGIFLAMMPLYYVKELEWSDTAYSGLTGTALLIGGLFSMVFGGTILNFFDRTRAFQILCALVAALGLLLAVAPWLGEFDGAMKAYRLVYMILDTMVIVAFISVAMAICSKQVAATQFAMYMALGNVGYSAGSAAFGPLGLMLSYESIFVVFASVSIAAIIAMRGISIVDHRAEVERLQGGT